MSLRLLFFFLLVLEEEYQSDHCGDGQGDCGEFGYGDILTA